MLETDARDRVIVALDCDRERALELAHELSGHAAWLKVGMTLYYAEGPEIVKTFKDLGFKVFLDLKFHDIPHQVRGAARSASLAGADLLSVHGLGSGAMLAACREGAEEAREDRAKLVAITVLTSMNQDALSEIGVESPVAEEAARTAEAVQDGWYRTGDIGFLDAEGFLTLVDRKNNLVISGGENVYPLEGSRCIKALAGVVDAVVAGVPDKRWGESLAAFVVRAEGSRISEADIVAHCARELGGYKKPHAVRFVDDLGRSASGKVSREQLEELKGLL